MGDIFKNLLSGFSTVGNLQSILWILVGVCVGILGGAIPGISPSMAVALLLPMTYAMSPTVALIMLMGIYIGANYGGSITAVAINTPGTPSATVTAFDGYPMLKKGRAGEAMGISLWASVFGGIISIFVLMFFSVPLSKAALKFWPSEYFALCIMGLTTVATLGGKNWQKALVSLQTYAERYPGGKYISNCNFYMAECYRNMGRPDQACDLYKKVIRDGQGSFVELSAANYAKLSYGMERWADAFEGYSDLHKVARIESNKLLALQGMMRSAYKGKDYPEAIKYASLVASGKGAGEADLREASYLKAKSLLSSGDRDAALEIMDTLADSPATPEGAEAAYLLIQDAFDRGSFKDVETEVYSLAESATPQTYWLAKSFIVLGDSFVENGDFRQARATFESIRDGYTPSSQEDDVPEEVAIRLAKLTQMGK